MLPRAAPYPDGMAFQEREHEPVTSSDTPVACYQLSRLGLLQSCVQFSTRSCTAADLLTWPLGSLASLTSLRSKCLLLQSNDSRMKGGSPSPESSERCAKITSSPPHWVQLNFWETPWESASTRSPDHSNDQESVRTTPLQSGALDSDLSPIITSQVTLLSDSRLKMGMDLQDPSFLASSVSALSLQMVHSCLSGVTWTVHSPWSQLMYT